MKFRSLDSRSFGSVALVDLLPGGFELVVPANPGHSTFHQGSMQPDSNAQNAGENSDDESGTGRR